MFKKRRREALEKDGVRATGVVVEASQSNYARQGNLGLESDTEVRVHLRVRVEPEGEAPFEVETRLWVPLTRMLSIGSRVTVLYDPADHERFSVLLQSAEEAAGAVFDRIEQHSGVEMGQLFGGDDRFKEVMAQAMKNPHGAADAVRAALDQSQLESWKGRMGQQVPAPPQQAPDRIDQLTKLAQLRNDGVLTDAEFQAEKHRLLGES